MKKMYCKHCKEETMHLEDVETFIHKPSELQDYTIWLCKKCWYYSIEGYKKWK